MTILWKLAAFIFVPLLAASVAGDNTPTVRPDGKYEICSEGIRGYFIPYGASLSNLFIHDIHGAERDIVLGFDNATTYSTSRLHPHLNGVPGRYANRIKNGTFAIDGTTYQTDLNDNGGRDTLHGGRNGWDYRNWTVVGHTRDSITFSLVDEDGEMGFPGQVVSYVTYTLTPFQWHIRMTAFATTKKTPIMLSSHTYWNLDGFQNPHTPLALDHTLHLPYAGFRPDVDNILIPTGDILSNKQYGVNDWWTAPKPLGANFSAEELRGNCGWNCTGYDNCYILNRNNVESLNWDAAPVASLASPWSGIQVDIFTEQEAVQIYTCNNMNGTLPLKSTQGFFSSSPADDSSAPVGRPRTTPKYGCVVIEVEDWIDGINHPEWGRQGRQIFGPSGTGTGDQGPYVLEARYEFSLQR
ncbi:galactose mutarotase-like protein [Hortaea werneckii]|nr:galactose mutarotase-like protein [Hortaea werneckii]